MKHIPLEKGRKSTASHTWTCGFLNMSNLTTRRCQRQTEPVWLVLLAVLISTLELATDLKKNSDARPEDKSSLRHQDTSKQRGTAKKRGDKHVLQDDAGPRPRRGRVEVDVQVSSPINLQQLCRLRVQTGPHDRPRGLRIASTTKSCHCGL